MRETTKTFWIWRRLRYLKTFFFASVLTVKSSIRMDWATEGKVRDWKNEEPPTVGEDHVWDQLRNLKVQRSMGPDEINSWILK